VLPTLSVVTIMRNKAPETYPMVRAMHQQASLGRVATTPFAPARSTRPATCSLLQAWEVSAAGAAAMEFIMVDNGSEEDTASTLLAALRNAPVLRMGRNAHWAGGNNAGMRCRSAASTTTLFWNNDAVPLEGTMVEYTHMARTMQRSAIGAVGCALQYPDGRLQVRHLGGDNGPVR